LYTRPGHYDIGCVALDPWLFLFFTTTSSILASLHFPVESCDVSHFNLTLLPLPSSWRGYSSLWTPTTLVNDKALVRIMSWRPMLALSSQFGATFVVVPA
jgi:hypothetical protein